MKRPKQGAYIPIGFRSYFSLLQGVLSPEDICDYAASEGYDAVGTADTNNFYGLIRFLKASERAGLRPVAGIRIVQGERELFTAYVLNKSGYARINRIVSSLKSREKSTCGPLDDLRKGGWEGLAIVTGVPETAWKLSSACRENLFIGLTYGRNFAGLVRSANTLGIPLLAVNDAFFIRPNDAKLCNLLRAVGINCRVEDLPEEKKVRAHNRAVSREEMEGFFSAVPEAMENTRKIAEASDLSGIIHESYVFPRFRGFSEREAYGKLKNLCMAGIKFRYPDASKPERAKVILRLNYELSIIGEKGFSGYFLVVHDIVSRCSRTCGRGSSASSIVSYLLGITHVDPVKHNLFFERFLNRSRKDPPDIDVDFPWDERRETLEYVFKTYKDHSGMVADHVTFGPRSSLREPAKALGIPGEEIKRLVRYFQLGKTDKLPEYLLGISRRIRGFPRYMGTHPGGVVITPEEITAYTHIQPSPSGYPLTAWDKDSTEDAGLVKIDLLGNRSLAVLRDVIELVNSEAGKPVDDTGREKGAPVEEAVQEPVKWDTFNPLENSETAKMLARGDTIGIFYVESPATRQLLKKMQRGDFNNLVIASSIIRPAANRYITAFVRRLHGERYAPLHPLIEETLRETCGIMVYQEDVSRIAIDLAGFSPGEADQLRKVITKKDRNRKLKSFRRIFFERGKKRKVQSNVLEEIWEMILSFDGYSFCKAHSASYAMVSYKLAYMKRFYPLKFMISVINNDGGYYTRQTYIDECRRMGFKVLGPDINRSGALYTIDEDKDGKPAMRVGLFQLRGIKRDTILRIIGEREKRGRFTNLDDFVKGLRPGIPEMSTLIKSGTLDSLADGHTRPELFWKHYHILHFDDCFIAPSIPKGIGCYDTAMKRAHEIETLGVVVNGHPLELFGKKIAGLAGVLRAGSGLPELISSGELPRNVGRRVTLAGFLVTGKEVLTKRKEHMLFLSFEDRHSVYETVLFPDALRRFRNILEPERVYLVTGRVEKELGAIAVTVEQLRYVGSLRETGKAKSLTDVPPRVQSYARNGIPLF